MPAIRLRADIQVVALLTRRFADLRAVAGMARSCRG